MGFFRTMTAVAALALAVGGWAGEAAAQAAARGPRIVVHGVGSASAEGLPALSGDGAILAVEADLAEGGEDEGLVVELRRVADLAILESVTLYRVGDSGAAARLPRDGLGGTLWERGRRVTERFTREGYRTLEPVGEPHLGDAQAMVEGAGLRILQSLESGRYTIRAARGGRELARGQTPLVPLHCATAEEDAAREIRPAIVAAWRDRSTSLLLLLLASPYIELSCRCDWTYIALRVTP